MKETLKRAHTSVMPATLDHYHAVTSIRDYGAIKHAATVAQVALDTGQSGSEAEAVAMAHAEVARTYRVDQGLLINRLAHQRLQTEEANKLKQARRLKVAPKLASSLAV